MANDEKLDSILLLSALRLESLPVGRHPDRESVLSGLSQKVSSIAPLRLLHTVPKQGLSRDPAATRALNFGLKMPHLPKHG